MAAEHVVKRKCSKVANLPQTETCGKKNEAPAIFGEIPGHGANAVTQDKPSIEQTIRDALAAFRQLTGTDLFLRNEGGEAPQKLQDAWEVFIGSVLAVTAPNEDRAEWIEHCLEPKRAREGQRIARMIEVFESRARSTFYRKLLEGSLKIRVPQKVRKGITKAAVYDEEGKLRGFRGYSTRDLMRDAPGTIWKELTPSEVRTILGDFDPLFLELTDAQIESALKRKGGSRALAELCCAVGAMGREKTRGSASGAVDKGITEKTIERTGANLRKHKEKYLEQEEERLAVTEMLTDEKHARTDEETANECGVSEEFVGRVKKNLQAMGILPRPEKIEQL